MPINTMGTPSSVLDTATATTILAANPNRRGATIYNDSTSILYLLLASGTASATNMTLPLAPADYYEVPEVYTGVIGGVWSADASGAARVTEFT